MSKVCHAEVREAHRPPLQEWLPRGADFGCRDVRGIVVSERAELHLLARSVPISITRTEVEVRNCVDSVDSARNAKSRSFWRQVSMVTVSRVSRVSTWLMNKKLAVGKRV